MQWLIVLSALLAVAAADGKKGYSGGYAGGKCSRDGFFYHSERAFTICSNGNAYVQPCAPGTRNSGAYKVGHYGESAHQFCSINLVDHGYAAKRSYGGYGNKRGGYGYGSYGRGGYGNSYGYGGKGYSGSYGYGGNGYGAGYGAGYGNGYGYGGGYGNGYGAGYGSGYGTGYGYGAGSYGAGSYGAGSYGAGSYGAGSYGAGSYGNGYGFGNSYKH